MVKQACVRVCHPSHYGLQEKEVWHMCRCGNKQATRQNTNIRVVDRWNLQIEKNDKYECLSYKRNLQIEKNDKYECLSYKRT
jgi:hypothetical protein